MYVDGPIKGLEQFMEHAIDVRLSEAHNLEELTIMCDKVNAIIAKIRNDHAYDHAMKEI